MPCRPLTIPSPTLIILPSQRSRPKMPRERRCILNVELLEERCVLDATLLRPSPAMDDWLGATQWEKELNDTRGQATPILMTPSPHPLFMTEVYPAFPWHLMDYQDGRIGGTMQQGDVDYLRLDVSAERR